MDVYGYTNEDQQPIFLNIDEGLVDVSGIDAVAVIPMHNPKFKGIKTVQASTFLEWGNIGGDLGREKESILLFLENQHVLLGNEESTTMHRSSE